MAVRGIGGMLALSVVEVLFNGACRFCWLSGAFGWLRRGVLM